MAKISIEHPGGVIGDIEAALSRACWPRPESIELASLILTSNGGIDFKTNKLAEMGVDPAVLVRELRAVGLRVRWSGEPGAAT